MRDQKLMLSESLVTSSGAVTNVTSTNVLDMGPLATNNLYRQLGPDDLYFFTRIESTPTSTGSATLSIKLTCDNNTGMTSTALVCQQTSLLAVASVTAGTVYQTPIPRGVNIERYLQAETAWATAPASAGGTVTQWIGPAGSIGAWYAYAQRTGEDNSF